MFQILRELRLILRPEKTFVGRSQKGFDLLGYHITLQGLSPSSKTQEKALEIATQRYAQGGPKPMMPYLKLWKTWCAAGLPLKSGAAGSVSYNIVNITLTSKDKSRLSEVGSRTGALTLTSCMDQSPESSIFEK